MTAASVQRQSNQERAARQLMFWSSGVPPVVLAVGYFAGNGWALATTLSVAFLALGWIGLPRGGSVALQAVSIAVIGQPIALTMAAAGHPWQMDMHMTFFAALAMLVLMVDVKALLVGAGLIVLHHLSLSLLMPALIYPSADMLQNVIRTLMHGAVIGVESAALVASVIIRQRLQVQGDERETDLTEARARAADGLMQAEAARQQAEVQRQEAVKARTEAEAAKDCIAEESRRAEAAHLANREAAAAEAASRARALEAQQSVVTALRDALARLSGGDLSVAITASFPPEYDSLRLDFNAAAQRLAQAIGQVADISGSIRSEARTIRDAAESLSVRTSRQGETLEQTSVTMSEIVATVRKSAHSAQNAEASTARARSEALGGGEVVKRAVQSMNRIAESSQKIAHINAVIDGIAFQTNLLALNAGVEAARAGEAGRGFAVVASEVRALSQRCSDAAKQITALIQEAGLHVSEGVELVDQTGAALSLITESVTSAAEQVAEIASTASAQSHSLGAVATAIADLDNVTRENASMFGQTTAACQSLDSATGAMIEMVSHFVTEAPIPDGLVWRRRA